MWQADSEPRRMLTEEHRPKRAFDLVVEGNADECEGYYDRTDQATIDLNLRPAEKRA